MKRSRALHLKYNFEAKQANLKQIKIVEINALGQGIIQKNKWPNPYIYTYRYKFGLEFPVSGDYGVLFMVLVLIFAYGM